MKTLVLGTMVLLSSFSFSQRFAELTLSVVHEVSERKLDSVWVHVYRNDSLIDLDSCTVYWGEGQFKGFYLETGHDYKVVVSKPGFVSKMFTVDTRCKPNDDNPYKVDMPIFVSLFPDCEVGDYEWMENTPLIKMYIDESYQQAWDVEYTKSMSEKVTYSHHGHLSDEKYDEYTKLYFEGQSLIEFQKYDEAMEQLLNAQEILNCFEVQYAIEECADRKKGLYNPDSLAAMIDMAIRQNDFAEAVRLFQVWKVNIANDGLTEERAKDRDYCQWVHWGNQAVEREDFETANYYYERALEIYPKATYPNERLEELEPKLNK